MAWRQAGRDEQHSKLWIVVNHDSKKLATRVAFNTYMFTHPGFDLTLELSLNARQSEYRTNAAVVDIASNKKKQARWLPIKRGRV